jgi:hypothetical protein
MLAQTDALKVDPNTVKQLGQGECVVIAGGRAQHVTVSQVRLPELTQVVTATTQSPAIAEIDPTRALADLGGSEDDTATAQPSITMTSSEESIRE